MNLARGRAAASPPFLSPEIRLWSTSDFPDGPASCPQKWLMPKVFTREHL